MRRIVVALAGAATLAVSLSGCASTTITPARLDAAVGPTFARLFVLQQQDRGPSGSTTRPDGTALCARGGRTHDGPGDDWTCTVNFPYADGHIQPIAYDVSVQGVGCYTATGPSAVVGQQLLTAADGRTVTNPLFEFDGCFDAG